MKYKVFFSGTAYVEADNTEQAESKFDSDQDYYRETVIDSVEVLKEATDESI